MTKIVVGAGSASSRPRCKSHGQKSRVAFSDRRKSRPGYGNERIHCSVRCSRTREHRPDGHRDPGAGTRSGHERRHPDEIIDTVLAGALSMVAAMLQVGARQPVSEPKGAYTDDEAYVAAQEHIVRGITQTMEKKIRESRRNDDQGADT